MRDRPGARAAELEVGTYYCACAIRTKWRLIHPETPVEFRYFSLAGSSSVGYRVHWCINHRLQPNQFVGRRDEEEEEKEEEEEEEEEEEKEEEEEEEEEEEKKKKMEKIEVRPISVYNCSGVF